MGTVVVILVVLGCAAGVIWHHRNRNAAVVGVTFDLPFSPSEVQSALTLTYAAGVKAAAQKLVTGIRVTGSGGKYQVVSRYGDEGSVEITDGPEGGARVTASTHTFMVGHPRAGRGQRGYWGAGVALTNVLFKLLGIAPGASSMKRFQNGLEGRLSRRLRSARTPVAPPAAAVG